MPALTVIEPPNVRQPVMDQRQTAADPKKKLKGSALCYTPPAMINDKKRDRSYFRRGLLGEGGFARCFEVTDFQGTRLAAKCIAKKSITSEKIKMKLLGEIKVHKSMDHPNIVRQRDCFEDDVNVYMILDICTNGTLMEMLKSRKKFTEPEVRYFGLQILGAAKYMHSRRVIHRDLKLGNLFLDENMCIKVGDFGLAALLVDDNDRKKTICGTPNYIAPEVLFASPEGHSYEVDLWSIGVIFYAMLVGKPPFQSKDVKAIYAKIKVNEYEFPASADISASAKSLITSLLSTDPDNRPSLDDIATHHFFNSGVMPRSIPVSAIKEQPPWPEGQAASVFKRNLNFVSINAGIGQDQSAGVEPGKRVDVVVEKPETGRYLPVSLSPRTGPAAKMVNLKDERAGGRGDSLSDRLKSVHIQNDQAPTKSSLAQDKLAEARARDLRRTTLGAGALRPQTVGRTMSNNRPIVPRDVDEPVPNPNTAISSTHVARDIEAGQPSTRLKGASRVVSEPTRPITRSARFTQISEAANEKITATSGLTRPLRRTASSTAAPESGQSDAQKNFESARVAAISDLPTTNRAHSRQSRAQSRQDLEGQSDDFVSRPVSRVASRNAAKSDSPYKTTQRNGDTVTSTNSSRSSSVAPRPKMWAQLIQLADWIVRELESPPVSHARPTSVADESFIIHISKWVDYSHRYGLGYQLSNESTGVYFNDATSIILQKGVNTFDFISPTSAISQHSLEAPPKELEKKVYLLKHFKGYMTAHLNNAATDTVTRPRTRGSGADYYMTHYWRTKAGILFRLADGTLQLNFTDHSKLMIPAAAEGRQSCRVRYVDTDKNTHLWSLAQAVEHRECREKVECLAKILHSFAKTAERQGSE